MIRTKSDLKNYILEDAKNYQSCIHPHSIIGMFKFLRNKLLYTTPISDQTHIWTYIKTLRKVEYLTSQKSIFRRIYYSRKLQNLSYKTGFQIPPNTIGKGLTIWHWGPIIINESAQIGENLTIQPQVVIGWDERTQKAPIIGNNVTIMGGVFIIGDVHIGDNVTIGCNSFVNDDVPSNCVVAGTPAKIIKYL